MGKGRGQRGVRHIPDDFDLTAAFCGITSEPELDAAIEQIDTLLDQEPNLNRKQRNQLDSLSDQVEKYEDEHHPMPSVSAHEMLHFLMSDCKPVTPETLSTKTGIGVDIIYEYLRGTRRMSVKHMQVLARYFNVEPSVFDYGDKD